MPRVVGVGVVEPVVAGAGVSVLAVVWVVVALIVEDLMVGDCAWWEQVVGV